MGERVELEQIGADLRRRLHCGQDAGDKFPCRSHLVNLGGGAKFNHGGSSSVVLSSLIGKARASVARWGFVRLAHRNSLALCFGGAAR